MKMSAHCMGCIVNTQLSKIKDYEADERLKSEYMSRALVVLSEGAHGLSPQRMVHRMDELHQEYFGFMPDYAEEKRRHNSLMMRLLPQLRAAIEKAPDPLMSALCHAQACNYIDISAVDVDDDELSRLLLRAQGAQVDPELYGQLLRDLEGAERLTYVLDNAGEIVMDKLAMEQMKKRFPNLHITAMVRGAAVSNDVTMDDAEQVGLLQLVDVISNGTPYAGTELSYMPEHSRSAVERADVIIAKGQGNFETLVGSGLNIYYLFLCKCSWFVKRFAAPRFTAQFINERLNTVSPYVD